jgi:hypothetical protein
MFMAHVSRFDGENSGVTVKNIQLDLRGMNIQLVAILGWTKGRQGSEP